MTVTKKFGSLLVGVLLLSSPALRADQELPWAFNAPRAKGYSIDLVAIQPAPGTPLVRGQSVQFTATLSYALKIAKTGGIILVFQTDSGQPAATDHAQVSSSVIKGKGEVTLTDTLVVPANANELRLFIPLVPAGIESTTGEVTIRWPIVDPAK